MLSLLIYSFFSATLLTGLIRRYAIRKSLIDIPNERSSHHLPVPRGGGLSIVLITLLAVILAGFSGLLAYHQVIALFGGGCFVGAIGWLDDHRDVSALLRMIVHCVAAIWTIYWLDGLGMMNLGFTEIDPGWFGNLLAVIAMVWLINLYNFMDGTDGIASVQAISTGSFVLLFFLTGKNTGLAMITLAMLGATTGFLLWNWSPAKIFMGDVGSGFLGYFFGALAIMGEKAGSAPILIWLILLALFFWDATLTLIQRFLSGEKWYAAHHSHAYQRFVQMGYSHERLALWFLAINVMILWPIAWFAMNYKTGMLVLALITAIFSAGLWFVIRDKYDKTNND